MLVFDFDPPAAQIALSDAFIAARKYEAHSALEDAPVPVFPAKSALQFKIDLMQPVLNQILSIWFEVIGWKCEGRLSDLTGGRVKDNGTVYFYFKISYGLYIVIEVQFGNGGRLSRDLDKFKQLHKAGVLAYGMYICFDKATSKTADSAVVHFDSARDGMCKPENAHLPVSVIGVSRAEGEVVDLSTLPEVDFPEVFGGKAEGNGDFVRYIATKIIERADLSTLKLPHEHRQFVSTFGVDLLVKQQDAIRVYIERALNTRDPELRSNYLEQLAGFARSSHLRDLATATAPSRPTRNRKPPALQLVPSPDQEAVSRAPVPGSAKSVSAAKEPLILSPTTSKQATVSEELSFDVRPLTDSPLSPSAAPIAPPPTPRVRAATLPGASGEVLRRVRKDAGAQPRQCLYVPVSRPIAINSQMGHAFARASMGSR